MQSIILVIWTRSRPLRALRAQSYSLPSLLAIKHALISLSMKPPHESRHSTDEIVLNCHRNILQQRYKVPQDKNTSTSRLYSIPQDMRMRNLVLSQVVQKPISADISSSKLNTTAQIADMDGTPAQFTTIAQTQPACPTAV